MNLDDELFKRLLQEAECDPRKRSHQNIHKSFDDPVQRLCIALVKGTYIRPHYHSQDNKWEMMLALRGTVGVLLFDPVGKVIQRQELSPNETLMGIDIVPGTWHAVFPLTEKAILLEIKEGPYCPLTPESFAQWSPTEGGPYVEGFLALLETAKVGDVLS